MELAPGNAAIVRRALVLAGALGRFDEARHLGRRALELDPLSRLTSNCVGIFNMNAGQLDEAEAAFRKALEIEPNYRGGRQWLGRIQLARSRPEAALREMELEKDPIFRRIGLALAYHALGRTKESDAALAELIEKDREGWAFQIAEVWGFRGESSKALEWLERAYAQHDPGLAHLKGNPCFKVLEDDPRYEAFLKKMGLPL